MKKTTKKQSLSLLDEITLGCLPVVMQAKLAAGPRGAMANLSAWPQHTTDLVTDARTLAKEVMRQMRIE